MREKGFTLVELVMVIIVISIISVFTISRSSDTQGYLNNIVRNQLIASARLAQQTALSRAASANVSLSITSTADSWIFTVNGGGGDTFVNQVDRGTEQILVGTNLAAACSTLAAVPTTIQFDGDGNRDPQTNLRICINSDVVTELCISPAGYLYTGTCL